MQITILYKLDAEIFQIGISNFFRKYLMELPIRSIDSGVRLQSETEIVKSVNASQAVSWVGHNWENVS